MEFHLAHFHSFCYPVIYLMRVYTYMHTYPFIIIILTKAVIFQEILYFHYDIGRQCLEIDPCIKFRLPQSFSLSVSYMHIHANQNVLAESVFHFFPRNT